MSDADAPGLLIELRQKTVQLLEAIDSGQQDEDAWQYTEERPHPNDPMLGRADSAPSELGSQGADAKFPAENLGWADSAREIEAIFDREVATAERDHESSAHVAWLRGLKAEVLDRVRADSARDEDHEEREGKAWVCMSCGFVGDRQSCGNCGAESRPAPVADSARDEDHEDRSAGRWCAICGQHGSHHTDRHPSPGADSARDEDHETICHECHGNGFPEDYPNRTCKMCFGTGKVTNVRPSPVDDTVRLREALIRARGALSASRSALQSGESYSGTLRADVEDAQQAIRAALSVDAGKPEVNDG